MRSINARPAKGHTGESHARVEGIVARREYSLNKAV
jgi:hypothetical protein